MDDGGSKITSYIVEKRDVRKDEWTVVASSGEWLFKFKILQIVFVRAIAA